MRRGGRILVILGLLLGAITAVGSFLILGGATEQARQIPTRPVVVALQPIPERSIINADAIGIKDWPETALPPGQVFSKLDDVINKLALQAIYPGQIILPPMVIDKKLAGEIGARSNAAFIIPEGKVAMAFSINEIIGVAGALQPGDRVDVLLTLQASALPTQTVRAGTQPTLTGTEGLPVTQLMLQNVLVLQVGNWGGIGQEKSGPATHITLALERQDALALKAAREQGQIDLVLRRFDDNKIVETEAVTLQYLNRRFKFNLVPLVIR